MFCQSVLVTGGGSGIGAAVAIELANRGCQVVISGRRQSALDATARSSERVSTCAGDVTDPLHRGALIDSLRLLPGPRAILHGAGYFQVGKLDVLSADDWHRSLATNVEARWALSRDAVDVLDGGRILFIGSDSGANPRVGAAAYSIAQAASETLRRAMQAEWAELPIDIGAFKPGLVDTEMVRTFLNVPLDEFPDRAAFEGYVASGEMAAPPVIARFASWLLLDVAADRFGGTEWDIRDEAHHAEWTSDPLYPGQPST